MAVKARTQSRHSQPRRQKAGLPSGPGHAKQGDDKPIAAVERALQVLSAFRIRAVVLA